MITEEIYKKLKNKKYFSGNDIKIGDELLFGVLNTSENPDEKHLEVVLYKPEEIGLLYEYTEYHPKQKEALRHIKYI